MSQGAKVKVSARTFGGMVARLAHEFEIVPALDKVDLKAPEEAGPGGCFSVEVPVGVASKILGAPPPTEVRQYRRVGIELLGIPFKAYERV